MVPCVITTLPSNVLTFFASSAVRRSAPTTISFSRSARSAAAGRTVASASAAASNRTGMFMGGAGA
jgi:hypothetical protein